MRGPEGLDAVAGGEKQQHTAAVQSLRHPRHQLIGARIEPVQILDQEADRLPVAESKHLIHHRLQHLLALLLRVRCRSCGARLRGDAEQFGEQRQDAAPFFRGSGQNGVELRQLNSRKVLGLDSGRVADVRNYGEQRAVLVEGRAGEVKHPGERVHAGCEELLDEPGFPNPCLAEDDHHATFAPERALPPLAKDIELGLSADELGETRRPRSLG